MKKATSSRARTESEANRSAIVTLMEAYGWDNNSLAEQLDVDVRTIQRWLGCDVAVPRMAVLAVETLAHRVDRQAMLAELDAERRRTKAKGT